MSYSCQAWCYGFLITNEVEEVIKNNISNSFEDWCAENNIEEYYSCDCKDIYVWGKILGDTHECVDYVEIDTESLKISAPREKDFKLEKDIKVKEKYDNLPQWLKDCTELKVIIVFYSS